MLLGGKKGKGEGRGRKGGERRRTTNWNHRGDLTITQAESKESRRIHTPVIDLPDERMLRIKGKAVQKAQKSIHLKRINDSFQQEMSENWDSNCSRFFFNSYKVKDRRNIQFKLPRLHLAHRFTLLGLHTAKK